MGVERLRLIGDECPAYAGSFAMTQDTARAVLVKEIERETACRKVAAQLNEANKELAAAQWWDRNGPLLVVGGVGVGGATGALVGYELGRR